MGYSSAGASRARAPPFCVGAAGWPRRCSRRRWPARRRRSWGPARRSASSPAGSASRVPGDGCSPARAPARALAGSTSLMGVCAVGALAATTGAELSATLGAAGVDRRLGLARWRRDLGLGGAARVARTGGASVLAAPPLAAAAWLREPSPAGRPGFQPDRADRDPAFAETRSRCCRRPVRQPAAGRRRAGDRHRADRHGARRVRRRPPGRATARPSPTT